MRKTIMKKIIYMVDRHLAVKVTFIKDLLTFSDNDDILMR